MLSVVPEELSFEHLIPVWDWIYDLMKVYQVKKTYPFEPKIHQFSNGYYTIKVN